MFGHIINCNKTWHIFWKFIIFLIILIETICIVLFNVNMVIAYGTYCFAWSVLCHLFLFIPSIRQSLVIGFIISNFMVHSIVNHLLRKFFLIVLVILKYNKNQLLYSIPLSLYRSVKNTYFIDFSYTFSYFYCLLKKKKIFLNPFLTNCLLYPPPKKRIPQFVLWF